jgi:hypothetical protein
MDGWALTICVANELPSDNMDSDDARALEAREHGFGRLDDGHEVSEASRVSSSANCLPHRIVDPCRVSIQPRPALKMIATQHRILRWAICGLLINGQSKSGRST